MSKPLIEALESIIQGEVHSSTFFRKFYSVDASSYQLIPKAIVIAKNIKDVQKTVKIARKFKTSVTVRGAGTGLVGSALNNGIIIDLKNIDFCKIAPGHIVVGPGIKKGRLDEILEKKKKFFPPNPSIGSFCSIGGMLGNNSSGSRSLKYGSVIDNILEISFVDGKGKIITLPKNKTIAKKLVKISKEIDKNKIPKVSKNSSGYRIDKIDKTNATHKIISGSEGTLGIIVSAKLKIKPIPKKRILFIIEYNSWVKASKNCSDIIKSNPSAIEFVDKTTLKQIKHNFQKNSKCVLFVEYDNNINNNEKKLKNIITGKITKKLKKESEIFKWWKYRDSSLHYSLKSIKKEKRIPHLIEDGVVPLEKLPNLFLILKKINQKFGTKSIVYGHAGNGNIHVRLISNRKNTTMLKNIAKEYFGEIIKLGGSITAEHGDGLARSEFVKKQYGLKNYQIFKEIKNLFDPYNILNPNKIITNKSIIVKNLEKL